MKSRDSRPIVVVGSANQDLIIRSPRPVRPGETILAYGAERQPGGKGANQAVAASRLGADVHFIGAVGRDQDGASLIAALEAHGVDTANVRSIDGAVTGLAVITVLEEGENSILVVPGANSAITPSDVALAIRRLAVPGALLVVQAELPPATIVGAIHAAAQSGMRVVFNLAPYTDIPRELLALADPLVVNESEASGLLGWNVNGAQAGERACTELQKICRSVVVTLGAAGACWASSDRAGHQPVITAGPVEDTIGAGDAFVGALAVALSEDADLVDAVRLGVAAGTFAVRSQGAQESYPDRADLS